MPKKKRVWYPGATYHIMCRGNHRGDIFRDQEDYEIYLTILRSIVEEFDTCIYSYCLMTNHVHIQLQTNTVDISKIMRKLNLFYTKFFNNKYNIVGHLFQGRYKSQIIENDAYSLQTSRYIHLNPVKARMVTSPVDYKWSSYPVYMGERKCCFIQVNKILGYFSAPQVELYKNYVESLLRDIDDLESEDILEE